MRSELAEQKYHENGIHPEKRPVLTISRTMGSGARIIAEKLAEQLGWSIWGKELLDEVANDSQVSRRVVEAFDEKTHSEIELLVLGIFGDHEMGGFLYARHLAAVLLSIAQLGNAIILGRGANFILKDALNIRIDASEEHRIKNMVKFENISQEEAEKRIRKSDHDRYNFLVRTYGKSAVDQFRYDLVINMDEFTNDSAVEIIKTAIRERYGVA